MKKFVLLPAIAAFLAPTLAQAEPVRVASAVFVEKVIPSANGRTDRVLQRAVQVRRGDQLVFIVDWQAQKAANFTVTNPLPPTIAYQKSATGSEEVSVDGGHTWGKLEWTRIREPDGQWRVASPEDVTHVRWHVPLPVAARGAGRILYRGIVR